ncbi:hypothetical protein [Mycobacterium sp. EPa45]|uniref:hypothetical protein n=1 Tax=Mycobacterium sp. EPa45 TaxID=1545728 RepID=UPI00118747A7|nr:hypothetical protein [Mycobacterium sp. EPa45]
MDFVQWIPLISALGVGGAIGGWVGASRQRREVRGGVLNAIAATESKRWAGAYGYREFSAGLRELETAALVARVPRSAVQHYIVFADAARCLSDDSYEEHDGDEEMGAGAVNGYYASLVRHAAEIVTQLAWRPWLTRISLRRRLNSLRARVMAVNDSDVQQRLALCQRVQGILPGPLGELPGTKSLPPMTEPEEA